MATKKSTSTSDTTKSEASLFLAGRNLAVIVVNELLSAGDCRCSIAAEYRDGLEQCDSMARAIEGLRTAPPAVVKGFAAVLTEMVGGGVSIGCPVSPEYIGRLTFDEMDIAPPARLAQKGGAH